ncbi:MAG: hypothetical protein Q8P67_26090 [archaeon]|nr:hypothetical protein [archaeon]
MAWLLLFSRGRRKRLLLPGEIKSGLLVVFKLRDDWALIERGKYTSSQWECEERGVASLSSHPLDAAALPLVVLHSFAPASLLHCASFMTALGKLL